MPRSVIFVLLAASILLTLFSNMLSRLWQPARRWLPGRWVAAAAATAPQSEDGSQLVVAKPINLHGDWHAEIPRDTRTPILYGFGLIALAFGGFGAWGMTAPIAGAIVTSGAFVATGQNKTIQHLEGGVIREILVHDGEVVQPGQVLVLLDDTTPKAELRRLLLREARLQAAEARLVNEAHQKDTVTFPASLLNSRDPEIVTILANQRETFEARRQNLNSDITAQQQSILALREHIEGTQVQLEAVRSQLSIIEDELTAKQGLLRQGLIRKPDVLALQRSKAGLQGEIGRLTGDIGDTKERIARAEEQIAGTRGAVVKAAVEQLQDVRGELYDVHERIQTARGVLDRIQIMAPVRGAIVKLRYHTAGGVVEPGRPIMDIVPLQDELVIEAHVRPQDIDHVKQGQTAMVRLTALSQRVTPMIGGEVTYVSADAVQDERGQVSDTYLARVRLDPREAAKLGDFRPLPGMPAEVYIKTTDRTFFEYVFKPIRDSMTRAFRET
jgi:HlyD family type I secretion membrane fusion protein